MELDLVVRFSDEERALFERLARNRGCSFDDAVALYLRRSLANEPDADESENVLFFPISGDS